MTIDDFLHVSWSEPGDPLIEPPRLSPVIADPSFLFPEETPDGDWALFAHSAWGVHRYSSPDGILWREEGLAVRHAMRPFVRRIEGGYALYYERYPPFALALTALPIKRPWKSTIAVSTSAELRSWSLPLTLVRPEADWMRDPVLGESVSNPCAVRVAETGEAAWRLYFSASLSFIEDCGFCEPRYIAAACGPSPIGPFEPLRRPILDPASAEDAGAAILGAGSLKAVRLEDGWIGLQNKIYSDGGGRSRSAIFALRSDDGLIWKPAREEPLLAPGAGWTASHVYACDCRYRESDGAWYLYFNARDGWRLAEGRERIGRILGRA
jgi:hypothetical protein